MRYYIYISDPKIDMLLPQIDRAARRKVTHKVGFDFKLFSGERSSETSSGDDRITRLETVTDWMRRFGNLGSIDEPGQYFAGVLSMRSQRIEGKTIFFGGHTDRTILGLGGSARNMVGSIDDGSYGVSHSLAAVLIAALQEDPKLLEASSKWFRREDTEAAAEEIALQSVHFTANNLTGPAQQLEFIAKRLFHGPSPRPERDKHDGMEVLLGTPLYVAQVD